MAANASAIVVDDDETARNLAINNLRSAGIEDVDAFENGNDAWTAMQKREYGLVVLDWKLPGLSGLALFNRIRRLKAYKYTPLLVISGFLDKNDFRLLQEFPVSALLEKPFTKVLFANKLEELQRETEWYAQNSAIVDTLMGAVDNDAKKLEALLKDVLKKAPNPIPLAILAARRMVKDRNLKAAEKLLKNVLERDDSCVVALNELGKVQHLSGDHHGALATLRRANNLSPQNMQRLCLLGEVELNLQDPEAARAYFEKALEVDADDKKAQAGLVVARNMDESDVLEPSAANQVSASFASILNTMGVALVRTGQYDRGIEQYRAALAFLREKEDAARVSFNLGLGYLRWGKPEQALTWFQKSERLSPAGFSKSTGYVKKLARGNAATPQVAEGIEEETLGGKPRSNVIPFPTAPGATDGGNVGPLGEEESPTAEAPVEEAPAVAAVAVGSDLSPEPGTEEEDGIHLADSDEIVSL